uniref:CCHC-type domain-containing protein n=1 Tax=Peronospora matthiolae TaxID=2874970 RepID=A0AAV1UE63_9STRA
MGRLLETLRTTSTAGQSMELFSQKKEAKRSWAEHFLYLVAVSDPRGEADSLVLDNIVHHALPDLMNVMRAKYDPAWTDYLRHAEESTHFATSIELGFRPVMCEIVATHVEASSKRKGSRKCFGCGKTGHIQANCRGKREMTVGKNTKASNADMVVAFSENKSRRRGSCGGRNDKAPTEYVNSVEDADESKSNDWTFFFLGKRFKYALGN